MSVPNQYASEGLRRRRIGDSACGSTVPRYGASVAISTMRPMSTAPATMVGWRRRKPRAFGVAIEKAGAAMLAETTLIRLSIAHARVDQGVADVDREVDEHIGGREQKRYALDDRVVAAQDGVDGQPPEPRDGSHGLGDDDAA